MWVQSEQLPSSFVPSQVSSELQASQQQASQLSAEHSKVAAALAAQTDRADKASQEVTRCLSCHSSCSSRVCSLIRQFVQQLWPAQLHLLLQHLSLA